MFSKMKFKKKVNDTHIDIEFEYEAYPQERFLKDMDLWKLKNGQKVNIENATELEKTELEGYEKTEILRRKGVVKALSNGKEVEYSYKDFKEFSSRIAAQYIFSESKNGLNGLLSQKEKITLTFIVMDSLKEECIAFFHPRNSTDLNVTIRMSGTFLLGRIYALWIYTKKMELQPLGKTVLHELEHYMMRETIIREDYLLKAFKRKIVKITPTELKSALALKGSAPIVFITLCNLYDEGIAVFVEKRNTQSIPFEIQKITTSIQTLIKVAEIHDTKTADDMYENDFCPTGYSGEYYLGNLMCYFIGLSIMKRNMRGTQNLPIRDNNRSELPFSELNTYLTKNPTVSLPPLDERTFQETIQAIRGVSHTQFFELYFEATRVLNLKPPAQFFTRKLISKISEKAGFNFWKYTP